MLCMVDQIGFPGSRPSIEPSLPVKSSKLSGHWSTLFGVDRYPDLFNAVAWYIFVAYSRCPALSPVLLTREV